MSTRIPSLWTYALSDILSNDEIKSVFEGLMKRKETSEQLKNQPYYLTTIYPDLESLGNLRFTFDYKAVESQSINKLIEQDKEIPRFETFEQFFLDLIKEGPLGNSLPEYNNADLDRCCDFVFNQLQNNLLLNQNKLKSEEILAICLFTWDVNITAKMNGKATKSFETNIYHQINRALQNKNKVEIRQHWAGLLFHLKNGLDKLPDVDKGTIVYRGVPLSDKEAVQDIYTPNLLFRWFAYSSCSLKIDVAKKFANPKNDQKEKGIIFCITLGDGNKNLSGLSAVTADGEILLSPNSEFLVEFDKGKLPMELNTSDGYYYIKLTQL